MLPLPPPLASAGKLDRATSVALCVGSAPYALKEVGVAYFLMFYYTQVLSLPSSLVSLAIFVATLLVRLATRVGSSHPLHSPLVPAPLVLPPSAIAFPPASNCLVCFPQTASSPPSLPPPKFPPACPCHSRLYLSRIRISLSASIPSSHLHPNLPLRMA